MASAITVQSNTNEHQIWSDSQFKKPLRCETRTQSTPVMIGGPRILRSVQCSPEKAEDLSRSLLWIVRFFKL